MEEKAKNEEGDVKTLSILSLSVNKLHVLLYCSTLMLRVNLLWYVKDIFGFQVNYLCSLFIYLHFLHFLYWVALHLYCGMGKSWEQLSPLYLVVNDWELTCLQHPKSCSYMTWGTRRDGQMSSASASCFERSGNLNLVGSNPSQFKSMTLKLILNHFVVRCLTLLGQGMDWSAHGQDTVPECDIRSWCSWLGFPGDTLLNHYECALPQVSTRLDMTLYVART